MPSKAETPQVWSSMVSISVNLKLAKEIGNV